MAEDGRDVIKVLTHDPREVEEMFDELTSWPTRRSPSTPRSSGS
ncbi:hypothetical protein [Actinomadura sp. KC06]|nr:hypothetical protein [Actinomadura sp. KC06]